MSKLLTWGLVAFLVFFVAFRPESASAAVQRIGMALSAIAAGLGEFVSSLVA